MAIITLLGTSVAGTSSTLFFNSTGTSSRGFQATVVGTGAVSADISISVSNDNVGFVPLCTFSLSGTNVATDAQDSYAPWVYIMVTVNTLTGTGATATITMGI